MDDKGGLLLVVQVVDTELLTVGYPNGLQIIPTSLKYGVYWDVMKLLQNYSQNKLRTARIRVKKKQNR